LWGTNEKPRQNRAGEKEKLGDKKLFEGEKLGNPGVSKDKGRTAQKSPDEGENEKTEGDESRRKV